MNPIIWYVAAAAMLSAGGTFFYWLNPPWTGPQVPIERNAPLEGDDGQPD